MTDNINKIENLEEIKQLINQAEAVLITAGAGMGVDSGLPDFRGNEGFWKAYPIAEKLNLSFTQLASPSWFYEDPFFAWAFYGHRYNLYKNTIPHDGFKMLLDFVKEKNNNYFIYTSNVDGQFLKAGFDEERIYECHGSISYLQCLNSCTTKIWESDITQFDIDMDEFLAADIPVCKSCGDIARPNILMFGDWHWNEKRAATQEAKYNKWIKQNRLKKLVVIELGAGITIATVKVQGQHIAKHYNKKLIRINPRDFAVDSNYGYSIALGAKEGLELILK